MSLGSWWLHRGLLVYVISISYRDATNFIYTNIDRIVPYLQVPILVVERDLFSYKSHCASVGVSLPDRPNGLVKTRQVLCLQWLMISKLRLNNIYWLVCFLARLSPSCKISGRLLHGWPLSKQHSFRLHGVTLCQMIWFFRSQSGRSSKSMIVFVRPCHCYLTPKMITHSCRSS